MPGLSPDYPNVHCNKQDVCVVTTGMGYANASATIMALTFSQRFDLRRTYFLISGIAGVDPAQGTVGSAAWSKYLVDFSLQWGRCTRDSGRLEYGLPRHQHEGERQAAARLSHRGVPAQPAADRRRGRAVAQRRAADSAQAQAARAKFNYAPANRPPAVIQCDTSSGNTWFSGTLIGERARQWTKILTDGKGTYCMTAQEDNATYEAPRARRA